MNPMSFFKPIIQPNLLVAALCLTCALPACSNSHTASIEASASMPAAAQKTGAPAMSSTAFITMAKESSCHQIRNKLYLIDGSVVFWDRIGNCPDNAHEQTLFGASPATVLATSHDSIAGPMQKINDEKYRAMYTTIMANRDAPDLGLGNAHKVQPLAL
jgi:hypothetical protein